MDNVVIGTYKFVAERITTNLYSIHVIKLKSEWFEHLHRTKTFEFPVTMEYFTTGKYWQFEPEKPLTYREFYDWCCKWIRENREVINRD